MSRAKKSKIRLYDVSDAVKYILDEHKTPYLRAIRLYEAQVAVVLGRKLSRRQSVKKSVPNQWLAVPRGILAAARVCSSVFLLQHIQKSRASDTTSRLDLMDNQDARDILSGMLLTPDGLRKIATAARPHTLSRKLRERRLQQRLYAALYDISLRFEIEEGTKLKGGWSTAVRIFNNKPDSVEYATVRKCYKGLKGRTAAYSQKDNGHFLAGFVWLRHFSGGEFWPKEAGRAGFARRLLAQVQDIQGLDSILGQYEFVRARLEQRGYKLLDLSSAHSVAPVEQAIPPLSDELLDAIL